MRRLTKALAVILALPLTYLTLALVLGTITINPARHGTAEITIYLLDNGVHSDIVVPLTSRDYDWKRHITPTDPDAVYVAFGWGDRNFYLENPTWRNLKPRTALRAISGRGSTIIHATYLPLLYESENSIAIRISRSEYRALTASIRQSFQLDQNDRAIAVNHHYSDNDAFYEAKGRYSLLTTCNTWSNQRLRDAGLKHVIWTPFSASLMRAYRKPQSAFD